VHKVEAWLIDCTVAVAVAVAGVAVAAVAAVAVAAVVAVVEAVTCNLPLELGSPLEFGELHTVEGHRFDAEAVVEPLGALTERKPLALWMRG